MTHSITSEYSGNFGWDVKNVKGSKVVCHGGAVCCLQERHQQDIC